MAPSDTAADRHRRHAGAFSDRVRGTRDWTMPAPVAGWIARDVVRHLVEWFPGFLAAGSVTRLPPGPSVDDDPVAAWQHQFDAVQAVLDDPATASRVLVNPHLGELPLDHAIDRVYTADVSELGAIRYKTGHPEQFEILSELISKEPLAPLVRADDPQFFSILRWTFFALLRAEELGVTSRNVDEMRKSPSDEVRRLLGVIPGNGEALGLRESWAYDAIKAIGNYGEMFDRNVGRGSPIKLDRRLNRLSTAGGLMFAPPLR